MSSSTQRVKLERTIDAPIEDVWELWTTAAGIESWWGPDGFEVKVQKLEPRPGGEMVYAMTAVAPDQVDFLKKAGMPVTSEDRMTFTEVVPFRRLAYTHVVDFLPGVKPYRVDAEVDFEVRSGGVRMVLTMDAMHDEKMTRMAVLGWESQLGKLAKLLAR